VLIAADGVYRPDPTTVTQAGFLCALSLSNGRNVWGKVDADGGLVADTPILVDKPLATFAGTSPGGLAPFGGVLPQATDYTPYPATTSSGVVDPKGNKAYANDYSCFVNARGLRRGGYWWSQEAVHDSVYSTMALFDDTLYYGGNGGDVVGMGTDQNLNWLIDEFQSVSAVYASPAIEPSTGTTVVGDASGTIVGVAAKSQHPPDPIIKWQPQVTTNGESIYASALVAPNASGGSLVFIGGDDKLVHVLGISGTGGSAVTALGALSDSSNPNGAFDGPVRASAASMDGRVYVLIHGHVQEDGTVDYPTKVYCFGAP
jgi:hypothetical protein